MDCARKCMWICLCHLVYYLSSISFYTNHLLEVGVGSVLTGKISLMLSALYIQRIPQLKTLPVLFCRQHCCGAGSQSGPAGRDHWLSDSATVLRPRVPFVFPQTAPYSRREAGNRVRLRPCIPFQLYRAWAFSCNYELKLEGLTPLKKSLCGSCSWLDFFLFLYNIMGRILVSWLSFHWHANVPWTSRRSTSLILLPSHRRHMTSGLPLQKLLFLRTGQPESAAVVGLVQTQADHPAGTPVFPLQLQAVHVWDPQDGGGDWAQGAACEERHCLQDQRGPGFV